jgi:hypothetical protein
MATRMQQRKGTAAQWISTNSGNGPVLNPGEIGFEIDTNKFKIGDGVSHWVDLNYFTDSGEDGGNLTDYVPLTQKGAANGVATLNADGVIPSEQIPSLVGLDTEIADAVSTAVGNLVDSAPAALNTLNELAAALGDDANFSTTIIDSLNTKATTEYVDGEITNLENSTNDALDLKASIEYVDGEITTLSNSTNDALDLKASIEYVDGEITTLTSAIGTDIATAVTDHNQESTNVHGIDDTTVLVTLSGTETIANKTLNDPTIVVDPAGANISISSTEISYLNNVSSNIQTQLNDKAASADIAVAAQDAVGGSIGAGLAYDTGTNVLSVDQTAIQSRVADVSDTEIGYLNGVTSGIQAQIDGKQAVVANVSDTEIGYLDGVTSGIQAQINDKAPLASPALTGTPTAPTATAGTNTTQVATTEFVGSAVSALVASAPGTLDTLNELATALGNDASFSTTVTNSIALKAPINSPTFTGTVTIPSGASISGFAPLADPTFTGTVTGVTKSHVGLGNVDNTSDANKPVSSATQTALDAKANSVVTINNKTANYTLVLGDAEKMVEMNVGSANTLTVPLNASVAYAVGTRLHVVQIGSGQTTITPTAGVTINGTPGLKTRAQYSAVTLVKRAENTWIAFGDLTA